LASYLVTRLYLAAAIQRADGVGGEKIRQLSNLSLPELETLENTPLYYGDETPPFSPRAKEVANKVLNLPLDALTSWRDIRVWAKAKLAHGEFADANSGYVRALELAPADAELYLGYAIALSGLKTEPSLVLTQLEHARDSLMRSSPRELRKNVYKSLTYAQTFLRKPESFLGVLDTARDYLSVEDARTSAGLLFNVACAYGQAHGWLSEDRSRVLNEKELAYPDPHVKLKAAATALDGVAELTVFALRQAISRDSGFRAKLNTMLTTPDEASDDFVSLADNRDVLALAQPVASPMSVP